MDAKIEGLYIVELAINYKPPLILALFVGERNDNLTCASALEFPSFSLKVQVVSV